MSDDDRRTLDLLYSATYEELRRLASSVRRDFSSLSLSPTTMVHEAWLKLAIYAALGLPSRAAALRTP